MKQTAPPSYRETRNPDLPETIGTGLQGSKEARQICALTQGIKAAKLQGSKCGHGKTPLPPTPYIGPHGTPASINIDV
jgi:hypothetical protein